MPDPEQPGSNSNDNTNPDDSVLHGGDSAFPPINTATSIGGPAEFEAEKVASHGSDAAIGTHRPSHPSSGLFHYGSDETIDTSAEQPPPPAQAPADIPNEKGLRFTPSDDNLLILTMPPSSHLHPHNWTHWRKFIILATGILTVINSTLGSSLPSNAVDPITADFHITDTLQLPLPISCFLMGYIIGPLACGPLSESYGRKPIMVGAFLTYIIWTMTCAVAPNWPALLIFRLLCGISASAPVACVGGLYADIYGDPRSRGRAMSYFMVATTLGPVMAPPISGFISAATSWRWVFGAGTFIALLTLPLPLLMEETYLPVLLEQHAKRLRKQYSRSDIIAASALQKKSWAYMINVVMTRPFRMLFHEAIVSCAALYLSLVYAIFYLYFQSYPLIFMGEKSVYNFSPGVAGLTFIPIFVGSLIGLPIFLWWDRFLSQKQAAGVKWAKKEEFRRLPLACLGGPMFAASIFWLGWTARPDIHWIVPVLSGVPFGCAFLLIFMSLLNYLSDAYLTFAASAQGMASTCRSIGGATLPLAGRKMFTNLGIDWACSVLAFLALGVAIIPYVFIRYGKKIRENSKFCQELRRIKEKEEDEEEDQRSKEVGRRERDDAHPVAVDEEKRRGGATEEV